MQSMEVKLNDLPELPFEKILGYLPLEDLIRSRVVSRRWCQTFDRFKVKSLCFSDRPSGFIFKKSRWVNGAFAQNFICSTRLEWFYNAFGKTIFSKLKNLRLCELSFSCEENGPAFGRALSLFDQLEELGLYRFNCPDSEMEIEFELNLPMLNSIHLEELHGIQRLTVTAPRLQNVKIGCCSEELSLVILPNAESVETLATTSMYYIELKKFKNLKYFYDGPRTGLDHEILFRLAHLREIHLSQNYGLIGFNVPDLFKSGKKPKALKIFLFGFLLNGPDDPVIRSTSTRVESEVKFGCLAENYSRLVAEIPFVDYLFYQRIEPVASTELAISVLKRFTDLHKIVVNVPVQNIKRFLDILKNSDHIVDLEFFSDQRQDLFDGLPDHCAVQHLTIWDTQLEKLGFLSRLHHLIELDLDCSTDAEFTWTVFEEHPFLSVFEFQHAHRSVHIQADQTKEFQVWFDYDEENYFPDLNAAIQFIFEMSPKKRKAGDLSAYSSSESDD